MTGSVNPSSGPAPYDPSHAGEGSSQGQLTGADLLRAYPALEMTQQDADTLASILNQQGISSIPPSDPEHPALPHIETPRNSYNQIIQALAILNALIPQSEQTEATNIQQATDAVQGLQNSIRDQINAQFDVINGSGSNDQKTNETLSFISQLNTFQSTVTSTLTNMTSRVSSDVTMLQSAQGTLTQQIQTAVNGFIQALKALNPN